MADDRGRRRTRRLTDDERALWDYAARSMTRLERAKGRVHAATDDEAAVEAQPVATKSKPAASSAIANGHRPPKPSRASPAPVAPKSTARAVAMPSYAPPVSAPKSQKPQVTSTPGLTAFDQKSARRLRGGRAEIEARLDLHGMRQDEARAALVTFLRQAQSRGHRHVLVITGKGAPRRDRAGTQAPDIWTAEPGVLRRNVPVWLAAPELRSLVVSYTEAGPQHGGAGALYVQVRSRG